MLTGPAKQSTVELAHARSSISCLLAHLLPCHTQSRFSTASHGLLLQSCRAMSQCRWDGLGCVLLHMLVVGSTTSSLARSIEDGGTLYPIFHRTFCRFFHSIFHRTFRQTFHVTFSQTFYPQSLLANHPPNLLPNQPSALESSERSIEPSIKPSSKSSTRPSIRTSTKTFYQFFDCTTHQTFH